MLIELKGVEENYSNQTWAAKFESMLLNLKHAKEKTVAKSKATIHRNILNRYSNLYEEIMWLAYGEKLIPEHKPRKREWTKLGKLYAL